MAKIILVGEEHTHPLPPQILKYIFSKADLTKSALISEADPEAVEEYVDVINILISCLNPKNLADGACVYEKFDRKNASKILFSNFANLTEAWLRQYKDENKLKDSTRDLASRFSDSAPEHSDDFFLGFYNFFREELKDAKSLEAKITLFALEMAYFARLKQLGKFDEKLLEDFLPRVAAMEEEFGFSKDLVRDTLLRGAIPIQALLPLDTEENRFDFYCDFLPKGRYLSLKQPLSDAKPFPSLRNPHRPDEESRIIEEMNVAMLANITKAIPELDLIVVNCGAMHCNYLYENLTSLGHEVIKMACINETGSFSQSLRAHVSLPEEDYVTSFPKAKRMVDKFMNFEHSPPAEAKAESAAALAAASQVSVWSEK